MLRPGYNHIVLYGQSLSTGWEGWPALSTAPGKAWMIGRSIRSGDGEMRPNRWTPATDSEIHPLVATVQTPRGEFCSQEQVAGFPQRTHYFGETPGEGAGNFLAGRVPDPAIRILVSGCGIGGRNIAQLSRGATPEIFNRVRDCCRAARAAADGEGKPYQLAGIMFLQGENDCAEGRSREDYRGLLHQLIKDLRSFAAEELAQQGSLPIFSYQTSSRIMCPRITGQIAQAQLDVSQDTPEFYLAGPSYPVTDRGVHLDANGYRWLGNQFGKVMHHVLLNQQRWRPLSPISAVRTGEYVDIRFHVPSPPLRWDNPFRFLYRFKPENMGFRIVSEDAPVAIVSTSLLSADTVRIRIPTDTAGALKVSYADGGRNFGSGCLTDSDDTVADDLYEYAEGRGHYPEANRPEMVGKPYPLNNWCVGFIMDVA